MDSNEIELIEVIEEEIDWITPTKKNIAKINDEVSEYMTSLSKQQLFYDRIIRRKRDDTFIIYIQNKLYILNSSTLTMVIKEVNIYITLA